MPSFLNQGSNIAQSSAGSGPEHPSGEIGDIVSTFTLFKDYFDKKLRVFKGDFQKDWLSHTDSAVKKHKRDSNICFRFERNKKQFYFNSDLAEKVLPQPRCFPVKNNQTLGLILVLFALLANQCQMTLTLPAVNKDTGGPRVKFKWLVLVFHRSLLANKA